MERTPRKILIVRTDRLGDLVLSTPVIQNLKEKFPDSYIAFICRPYTQDILKGNPYLNEIIVYDKYQKQKGLWASVKFSNYLRKKKFDWAIILHPTNRVHLITFFAGIPFRLGWNKKMGWLLTKRIPHLKQEGKKHELEYTLDLLRSMKIPIKYKETYFSVSELAKKETQAILEKEGLSLCEKFIVIHPSASCRSKRWPADYFEQLIKLLKDKIKVKIIIITSESEKEIAQQIIKNSEVIDLRGKLSISQIGALLKAASLFISNDSGPVHIAASLGTPVISIFGRSDSGLSPERWKPLGDKAFYFHKNVGCPKCLAHDCKRNFLCLRNIQPEEIAEKTFELYF